MSRSVVGRHRLSLKELVIYKVLCPEWFISARLFANPDVRLRRRSQRPRLVHLGRWRAQTTE